MTATKFQKTRPAYLETLASASEMALHLQTISITAYLLDAANMLQDDQEINHAAPLALNAR